MSLRTCGCEREQFDDGTEGGICAIRHRGEICTSGCSRLSQTLNYYGILGAEGVTRTAYF